MGKPKSTKTIRERLDQMAEQPGQGKGKEFERWLAKALPQIPAAEAKAAWMWKDASPAHKALFKTRREIGSDLIVERWDGGVVAVQAKCIPPGDNLSGGETDAFWALVKENPDLADYWLVTTGGCTETVHQKSGRGAIIHAQSAWGDIPLDANGDPAPQQLQLDSLQRAAFNDCVKGFTEEKHKRGRLIMACGTGKTLVSLRVAETLVPVDGLVVFAAPSIGLVAQSRRSWLRNTTRPMRTVVICSDKDAGNEGAGTGTVEEIECPVTTDAKEIADAINKAKDSLSSECNGLVAVFTTYQSILRLCAGQGDHGAPTADFAVADEAHWTAGRYDRNKPRPFQAFHHLLKAKRRMYQTATPRIYSKRTWTTINKAMKRAEREESHIRDMGDLNLYGPRMHRLSFVDALEKAKPSEQRLVPFKVVVLESVLGDGLSEAQVESLAAQAQDKKTVTNTTFETRVASLGLAMQVNGEGDLPTLRSCVAFCSRVDKASAAAKSLGDERLWKWAAKRARTNGERDAFAADDCGAGHLSGDSRAKARDDELTKLRDAADGGKHVTVNVKVLSEGIDMPALDAVCFLEGRDSEIEIVQAVGRVMRHAPGKEMGYIIVPVVVNQQDDLFRSIEGKLSSEKVDFRILGQVLQALRAHNPKIETDFEKFVILPKRRKKKTNQKAGDMGYRGRGGGNAPLGFWGKLAAGKFDSVMPSLARLSGLDEKLVRLEAVNLIKMQVGKAAAALNGEEGMGQALRPAVGVTDNKYDPDGRACVLAALTLMNACLVHQRLVETGAGIDLLPLSDAHASASAADILRKAWNRVLEHDYAPIFNPALRVLDAAQMKKRIAPQGLIICLNHLAEHASEVAEKYAMAGMDHAGELFQGAMETAQADGAYYTLPSSAMLLAELTCDLKADEKAPIWGDPATWRRMTAMDPACGSGTLLTAFAAAVRRRAELQGADVGAVHKSLVEDGLVGMDINVQAIQIAASQLAIGGLGGDFRRIGLWPMERGLVKDEADPRMANPDKVRLGSLELLRAAPSKRRSRRGTSDKAAFAEGVSTTGEPRETQRQMECAEAMGMGDLDAHNRQAALGGVARDPKTLSEALDRVGVVLTNPPFSSPRNVAIDLEEPVRKAMAKRFGMLKELVGKRWPEGRKVMQANSMSPPFSVLVSEILDGAGGVLGKIVPTTALNSIADVSIAERCLLAEQFELLTVVTPHDPKRLAWSIKGHQESLLLMRRRDRGRTPFVRFVQLRKFPWSTDEVAAVLSAIRSNELPDAMGCITYWPRDRVDAGEWWPALFHDSRLSQACGELEATCAAHKDFAFLGEVHDTHERVGRTLRTKGQWDMRLLKDGASLADGLPVLKSSSKDAQTAITGTPDAVAVHLQNKDVSSMQAKAGRLLIANGQNARSARLHAVALKEPSVGSKWTPITGLSHRDAKALAVWLNATPARLFWRKLGARSVAWPNFGTDMLDAVYVPDVTSSGWSALRETLLDAYKHTSSMKVPQFQQGDCEVRRIWDAAAAKVLGIDDDKVSDWRLWLNSEPATCGKGENGDGD